MAAATSMDDRLRTAIATPGILAQVEAVVDLALEALAGVRRLDEGLYERFVLSRVAPLDPAASIAGLRALWARTFGGVAPLLARCRELGAGARPATAGDAFELDLGELDGAAPRPAAEPGADAGGPGAGLDLGAGDIGDLLDGIDEQAPRGDAERWAELVERLGSIEFGLRTQHGDAEARFELALGGGEAGRVLAILDDAAAAAGQGIHALILAVYEVFAPGLDTSDVVPGHLSALGRALMVRRGIARLVEAIEPHHAALQEGPAAGHVAALAAVRGAVRAFVGSEVCRSMRAADRWQMVQFEQVLASQAPAVARQTVEGLSKYLESLASINQREVLLDHDRRVLGELREAVAGARSLLELSPRTAGELLGRAYQAALELRGWQPAVDARLGELERGGTEASTREAAQKLLGRVEAVLAIVGG